MPPGYEGEKKERRDNDDEGDFNLNVGKVIDALRRDYPRMFEEPLDFDIYTPDLQLQDPVRFDLNTFVLFSVCVPRSCVCCSMF